jgi:hypothetical protein
MISFEPALDAGKRIYTIVFSSNAPDPGFFDGADSDALATQGNQEIWIYRFEVDEVSDLTTGSEITPVGDLTLGTFRQITDTPPSRPLRTGIFLPDVLDDNREATISDDGNTLAFISNRDLVTAVGNADGNAELFLCRTTNGFIAGSNTVVQGTNTQDLFVTPRTFSRFQQNPSLSANGGVVAFLSTADLAGNNNDDAGHGNGEIYVADFSGSAVSNFRQLTKTKELGTGANATINLLSPGRRLSRDGAYVAYESRAVNPTANNTTNAVFLSVFVSRVSDGTAKMVGQRPPECATCVGDVIHFPTFTDYGDALAPHALVFAAALNFKPDGTLVEKTDATGLNATPTELISPNQIFVTQVPVTDTNTFARLTKNPAQLAVSGIRPLTSSTLRRLAFSMGGLEIGGGNSDGSSEVFLLLTPPVTTEASEALSFFTGASNMGPFAAADPSASPSPTPTPTPSPGDATGLSAGELSIVRSTVGLANSDQTAGFGSETERSPILPVELNGVSVAIQGVAAGLYFVGDTPEEGIRFVVPLGFTTGTASVVINNQGTVYRGFLRIVASQPDIHTSTHDAGGDAVVCNVSNPMAILCVGPFQVTSPFDLSGTLAPTRLEIYATGVRNALPAETKVSFVNGTTTIDVVPDAVRPNPNMLGLDVITVTLPATLAGTAPIDYKLIVTVTKTSATTGSRPVATAPQITIIP